MPGNHVLINNGIEYYVGDSKIEELIAWLNTNGIQKIDGKYNYNEKPDTE